MVKKTKKSQKSIDTAVITVNPLTHDMVLSLLIVSLVINAYVLVAWIALQVTTAYDSEVAMILFSR